MSSGTLQISAAFKIKVVAFAKVNSKMATQHQLGVSESSVQYWQAEKLSVCNPCKTSLAVLYRSHVMGPKTKHCGRRPATNSHLLTTLLQVQMNETKRLCSTNSIQLVPARP